MMSELAVWLNEIIQSLPHSDTGVPSRWHRRVFMQACSASPPFSKKLPSWKAAWIDVFFCQRTHFHNWLFLKLLS